MRAASCEPLRADPVVDQAAANINRSTDAWLEFSGRAVPEPDALPLLKDLGYAGNRSTIVSGAAVTDAAAIKGLLLQGYSKIPDCSYTDYGLNVAQNARSGYVLAVLVLAGA